MFLSDIPVSALLLCYGPLVITVLGFIVFAFLTDVNARRSYLRRNPGADAGVKEAKPVVHTSPLTAEVPAGGVVTIRPQQPASQSVAATSAPTAPAPAPVASDKPDNLTRIEGIGPKMAQALIAAGLGSFAKVAAASEDDFKAALEAAGLSFAPSMESWAEQASYAAKGDWDGLNALQATLVSGRYPT